jgi:DNA-directed RNA polymerase sigma subunit (sigma70/sigma32)
VTKIASGYRGYGLPISEVVSEGNIGLLQAVERFDPEKGFRLSTYATWWIKAAIQECMLRSWSLVRMGTTANQKKLFFNLRKAKSKISALDEGDMRPDQVKLIAKQLGVTKTVASAAMPRSTPRSAPTAIPPSGRTAWWTNPRARRRRDRCHTVLGVARLRPDQHAQS